MVVQTQINLKNASVPSTTNDDMTALVASKTPHKSNRSGRQSKYRSETRRPQRSVRFSVPNDSAQDSTDDSDHDSWSADDSDHDSVDDSTHNSADDSEHDSADNSEDDSAADSEHNSTADSELDPADAVIARAIKIQKQIAALYPNMFESPSSID